jgi:hypothetical protein
MDETRFDAMLRSFRGGATRRGLLGIVTGLAALQLSETLAKGKHRSGGMSQGKSKSHVRAAVASGQGQGRYQTLAAKWWAWAIDLDKAPILDTGPVVDCSAGQQGNTWYLAGSDFGVGSVQRRCTVPQRTKLFFPVLNGTVFAPPAQAGCPDIPVHTTKQLAERRACLADFFDTVDAAHGWSLTATVDGKPVDIVRATSALFPLHLDDDNPYDVPAGNYLETADGFWVLLDPLSPGEHKIAFTAKIDSNSLIAVSYDLTVA